MPHRDAGSGRRQGVLVILLALLSTAIDYRFGTGNQVENIPVILRQLDPTYLANDFFVSAGADFGPRVYFASLVGAIAKAVPLAWVFLGLTFVTDLALVSVTLWAAARVIGSGYLGSAIAAVLALGVSSFHLGDATQIRYEVFQQASLALPLALWAVALGLLGRPVAAASVASVACLAHPIYGAHAGALAIAGAFAALSVRPADEGALASPTTATRHRLAWAPAIARCLLAAAILGAAIGWFWWWPYRRLNAGVELPTAELIDVLGRFRAPHHYLPSQFRPADWVAAALFVVVTAVALVGWARERPRRRWMPMVAALSVVATGCLAGWVLVEIWPVRAVFTLQPFRLLAVLKWLGFLLVGWQLARYWQRPPSAIARPLTAMAVLSTGVTQPVVTSVALVAIPRHARVLRLAGDRTTVAVAALATLALWLVAGSLTEWLLLAGGFGLVGALASAPPRARLAAAAVPALLLLAVAVNAVGGPVVPLAPLVPVLDLDDLQDAGARVSRAAAAVSPPDAVFVTPPSLGLPRIVGRRALVVDFKGIPLGDAAMLEWRERMRAVFGDVPGGGFPALDALEARYRRITDAHLAGLAERYGATHAILYAETPTSLPDVHVDATYRVVRLSTGRGRDDERAAIERRRRPRDSLRGTGGGPYVRGVSEPASPRRGDACASRSLDDDLGVRRLREAAHARRGRRREGRLTITP